MGTFRDLLRKGLEASQTIAHILVTDAPVQLLSQCASGTEGVLRDPAGLGA
jgi:hypothetical protein